MTSISALNKIYKKGIFGNYENKDEGSLLKISEIKNLLIVQIVQYKNSSVSVESIDIGGLSLKEEVSLVSTNKDTRILWFGPKNWLLISTNRDLLKIINQSFKESDFAITDLSHSRAIIQIEGKNSKEILKKGCPFNFDQLKKNNCVNSVFNGITITIDLVNENPNKIRLFALRSFGQSLYHSITDACLEFGYKNL
jgi:heterotetrameric sarcosine oxidase gamma subunit